MRSHRIITSPSIIILLLVFFVYSAIFIMSSIPFIPLIPSMSPLQFMPLPCVQTQAEAADAMNKMNKMDPVTITAPVANENSSASSTNFTWKPSSSASVYSIPKQIRYTFSVQNMENKPARDLKLWISAPCLKTSYQALKSLKTSSPAQTLQDQQGNLICEFSIPEMSPYDTKIFRLWADLGMSDRPKPDALASALPNASSSTLPNSSASNLSNASPYTQPEKLIESDQPLIKEKALKLKKEDTYKTARAVYQWVADNIKNSGYLEEDKGALYALTALRGDCTEYAALFVALCRAAGIPARMLGGYVCQRNCIVSSTDFHNWAEFYHEGAWHLADPQSKLFDQGGEDYIATEVYKGEANTEDNQNPIGGYHRYRFLGEEGMRFKVKMTD